MSEIQYIIPISKGLKIEVLKFDCAICEEHYDYVQPYICSVCDRDICVHCMWTCDECIYDCTYCKECTYDHYP